MKIDSVIVTVIIAGSLGGAGGCAPGEAKDRPSFIGSIDEIIALTKDEKDSVHRDVYIEKLRKLKSQLLAEKKARARREKHMKDLEEKNRKLEDELRFLKENMEVEVKRIEIAFYTGGKDRDKDKKDDYIEATVCPKDGAGNTFKALGTCRFKLYRKSQIGLVKAGKALMKWDFSYERVSKAWVDTLFRGYTFTLRWNPEAPPPKNVVLEAIFTTPDGKTFDARKKLKLKL